MERVSALLQNTLQFLCFCICVEKHVSSLQQTQEMIRLTLQSCELKCLPHTTKPLTCVRTHTLLCDFNTGTHTVSKLLTDRHVLLLCICTGGN